MDIGLLIALICCLGGGFFILIKDNNSFKKFYKCEIKTQATAKSTTAIGVDNFGVNQNEDNGDGTSLCPPLNCPLSLIN